MDETTMPFPIRFWTEPLRWDTDIDVHGFSKVTTTKVVQDTVTTIYKALQPAHLHFGYRTAVLLTMLWYL